MTAPRRIAVLHDSPDFGGHERAFLTWLPAVLASSDVAALHFHVPQGNTALLEALAAFAGPKLTISPSRHVKGRGEPFRAPLRFDYGRDAAAFVAACDADLVLLLQGRIENLATPMLWLSRRLELVSYVPMAHSGVEMGRSATLSLATDGIKRIYYGRPDRFIVPSHAVAAQTRRAGARGPVHVVPNVPSAAPSGEAKSAARARLGLAPDARIALFMGRFDADQKGLDRLLRDLRRDAERLAGWCFLFVGQGPAEPEIQAALGPHGVSGRIVSWTPEPRAYLAASDVLLLPSRFEGVPLVMLEALQDDVPILGSDIDVFREYLQPSALRDFAGPVDLAAALVTLTTSSALEAYRRHAAGVRASLDPATSRQRFVDALLGRADPTSEPATTRAGAPASLTVT